MNGKSRRTPKVRRLICEEFALSMRLRNLEIHVAITVDLLAERDVDPRKRSVMLLIVPILPVQLIAFYLIRCCRLNGVIGESNQVELRSVALVSRLRLRRWRVLLLVLWLLLLGRNLTLRRIALLITVILLRGRRRIVAAIVSIRIVAVAVNVGIVRIAVRIIAVAVIWITESKVKARPPIGSVAAIVAATIEAPAVAAAEAAHGSTTETADTTPAETAAAAAETAAYATASAGKSTAAAGCASASTGVAAATSAMPATTTLTVSRSNQARGDQSGEEQEFRKSHKNTAFDY